MRGIVLGRVFGFGKGEAGCCGGAAREDAAEGARARETEPCCGSLAGAGRAEGAEACCGFELRLESCCAAEGAVGGGPGAGSASTEAAGGAATGPGAEPADDGAGRGRRA